MSIAPSTDIVLEVSRAADPERAAAVAARLNALSSQGASSPQEFAAALDAASAAPAAVEGASDLRGRLVNATLARNQRAEKAQTKLESVVLSEFIGEMLPKDTQSVYGQGYAGDMWRSMLAEHVADQIAASGRLGIGSRLFANHPLSASAELTAPEKKGEEGTAETVQASANALSAPSAAEIEHGAVLFARTSPL
jgi:Rod binding domain-containing protein